MSATADQDCWTDHAAFPARRHEQLFGSRVVRCFASRPQSVYAMFAAGVAANPDGEALVQGGRRLRYADLDLRVAKIAAGLRARGVAPGSRVGFLLGNCPDYVALLFAVAKLGAIAVPLNIREAAPELAYILNDCQASVLLCCASLVERLPVRDDIPLIEVIEVLDLAAESPLASLLADGEVRDPVLVDAADVAVILYTSGTTGRPKGAMLSHVNLVHSVLHYRHAMQITADDRSIIAVPMSHVTGLVALILTIANAGATLIIMGEFKADRFVDLAVEERMSHTLMAPAMFALCLLQPDIAAKDLSAWRVSGYGGAIMPEATLARIDKLLPDLRLINCYGATETSSPAVMMPPRYASARAHQVGLPVPCGDIRVMDAEGCEVPVGEDGEIWIAGPMVVSGYWNNPDATAREFVGGYWKSGDVGRQDAQGFLQIVDRIKDVINRGGYKIYASEVENLLLAHGGVQEVAVVARSCPILGERVHAFVVAERGVTEAELRAHCQGAIAEYKQPEQYHFVASLSRNANGKVLKRDLRAALEAR